MGEGRDSFAGYAVASAGDVDGDGLDDILIGAFGWEDSTGQSYLVLAASLGTTQTRDLSTVDHIFNGEDEGSRFGHALAGVGDVDGDGLDDVMFGSKSYDGLIFEGGKSYLFLGANLDSRTSTSADTADYVFLGQTRELSGQCVAGAGDMNGDGLADVWISAPHGGEDNHGATYLLYSPFPPR